MSWFPSVQHSFSDVGDERCVFACGRVVAATKMGSLKSELLVLLQERDGFAQPALACLFFPGFRDPPKVVTSMGRREAPKILPCLGASHQGLFYEGRHVKIRALFRLSFF